MDKIGLSPEEKANLFRVVATVLHLGNITFEESTKDRKGTSACPAVRLLDWEGKNNMMK